MSKRYILKKDTVELKAGTIVAWDSVDEWYLPENINPFSNSGSQILFLKEHVENNPEWFKEVKEPEPYEFGFQTKEKNILVKYLSAMPGYQINLINPGYLPGLKVAEIIDAIAAVLDKKEERATSQSPRPKVVVDGTGPSIQYESVEEKAYAKSPGEIFKDLTKERLGADFFNTIDWKRYTKKDLEEAYTFAQENRHVPFLNYPLVK